MKTNFVINETHREPLVEDYWSMTTDSPEQRFEGYVYYSDVAGTIEEDGELYTFSGTFIRALDDTEWHDLRVCPVFGSDSENAQDLDDLESEIDFFSDLYADKLGGVL